MSLRRGGVLGTVVVLALIAAPTASGASDDPTLSDGLTVPPGLNVSKYIVDIRVPDPADIRLPEPKELEASQTTGSSTVVTLNSDILFAFNKATISPEAKSRIAKAVGKIPRGARIAVGGHTDSMGSDASNMALSKRRADAVAAVIRSARSDLKLDVKGFGEAKPVAPNTSGGKDDPEGRAKNRRVEIRYSR